MELKFHEKARLLKSAHARMRKAKADRYTANKIYNDAKCWRRDASVETQHGQLKSYERLEAATADLKAAEAELRRIKLARVTEH